MSEVPELTRVALNLHHVYELLSLKEPLFIEMVSSNNKLKASMILEEGFIDSARISLILSSKEATEVLFRIGSHALVEINSIMSILVPLLQRLDFLSRYTKFLTPIIAVDAITSLATIEKILCYRPYLTNVEVSNDWIKAFEDPLPSDVFVSLFPFRDAMYVTVYEVKETNEPLRELISSPSPFNFSPGSVVKIGEKHYSVLHSIIAHQSQKFLAQTLRFIRDSIDDLGTLSVLRPERISEIVEDESNEGQENVV